jgi:DNA-binding NarL/FixJ family response regulator
MSKMLIVLDDRIIRDAIRCVAADVNQWLVCEAGTYQEALDRLEQQPRPDLVLLQICLPGKRSLDCLTDFREKFQEIPWVAVCENDDPENIRGAIDLGAMGFISKQSTGETLANAIRSVLNGFIYVPDSLFDRSSRLRPTNLSLSPTHLGLTKSQCAILTYLVLGNCIETIARVLNLTEASVNTHIVAIFRCLNVRNRTGAVVAASAMGLKLSLFDARKS